MKLPHRLYRLRTILLVVMLGILVLPLGSLYLFRVYENELVRQTEIELISQSAVLASTFKQLKDLEEPFSVEQAYYHPRPPSLDLYLNPILERRPEAKTALITPDPIVWAIGEKLQPIVMNTQRVTLAGFRILDENGVVIAGRGERGKSLAHIQEVKRALQGEHVSVIRERISDEPTPPLASISRGTSIRIFTSFPIIHDDMVHGVIYLSRTPQNIVKHLYDIRGKVIILLFIWLSVTFAVVLFIAHHLVWPIRHLIKQTQAIARGEQQTIQVSRQSGTYELAKLTESFSQMSETLHQRSTYIQTFASHVSHEFKTPLTAIQGALELLQEHGDEMSIEQRQKFLTNISHDTDRMRRLVNRLLELARADALQPNLSTCSVKPLLEQLQHYYQDLGLTLLLHQDCDTTVQIAADALESILRNLCDNSLQHHANQIDIYCEQENNQLILRLHDNGEGISKANQDRIFTPFFTTKREQGGTGLGLDIVRSLLANWGGEIEITEVESGACFFITLNIIS